MAAADIESDLLARWADISALGSASAVLGWDQETHMPPKGQVARGRALATLAGLRHDLLTDPALADLIDRTAEGAEPGSVLDAQTREARRHVVRAVAVPADLTRAMAETSSRALVSWQEARAADDFSLFRDDLAEVLRLTRDAADHLVVAGIAQRPYDALLDEYEPGATEAELAPLLRSLRDELAPLVQAAADSGVTVDESCTKGEFPADAQRAFGEQVARDMGYDFDAGRLDASSHPFTTGFGPGDVRITWRWEDDDFRPGLFGIMHEVGHALYEQGLPADWDGTPIGAAVSLGVHESQSRLWENLVGRSRPFWEGRIDALRAAFPHRAGVSVDELWPALHTCRPSLVRVEADEATYNLHIVARFEIERSLFDGDVTVDDLPEIWADTYDELLGVRPASAADGVLQDIHWSMGAFGYFPTYTLGNLISTQLFAALRDQLGDLDGLLAAGDLAPVLGWLREHVHQFGSRYPAGELVERATGRPLAADDFLAYLRGTLAEVYGLSL